MNPYIQRFVALALVFGLTMPSQAMVISGCPQTPSSALRRMAAFSCEALSPLGGFTPKNLNRKPTVKNIKAAVRVPRRKPAPADPVFDTELLNEERLVTTARTLIQVLATALSIDKKSDRPRRLKPFLDTYRKQYLLSNFAQPYTSPESFNLKAFAHLRYVGGDPVEVTRGDIARLRVMARALAYPNVLRVTRGLKNTESELISRACLLLGLKEPLAPRLTQGAAPFLREFILTLPENYPGDLDEIFIWFDQWVWENRLEPAQIRSMRQFLELGAGSDIWTVSNRRWMTAFIGIMEQEHYPRLDRGWLARAELETFPSPGSPGQLVPVTPELVGRVYYSPTHRSITLVAASVEDDLVGSRRTRPPILTTPLGGRLYPQTAWKKTGYGGAYILYGDTPAGGGKWMIGWLRDSVRSVAGEAWSRRNIERVEEVLFRMVLPSALIALGHHFSLTGDVHGLMAWPVLWLLSNGIQAIVFSSLHIGPDLKTDFWNRAEGAMYLGLLWVGYPFKVLWDLARWLLNTSGRLGLQRGFWSDFGSVISSRAVRLQQLKNRLIDAQGNISALSVDDQRFARDLSGYEEALIGRHLLQETKVVLLDDASARSLSESVASIVAVEAARRTKRDPSDLTLDIPQSRLEQLMDYVKTADAGLLFISMAQAWAQATHPPTEGSVRRAALWVAGKQGSLRDFSELLYKRTISREALKAWLSHLNQNVVPNPWPIARGA